MNSNVNKSPTVKTYIFFAFTILLVLLMGMAKLEEGDGPDIIIFPPIEGEPPLPEEPPTGTRADCEVNSWAKYQICLEGIDSHNGKTRLDCFYQNQRNNLECVCIDPVSQDERAMCQSDCHLERALCGNDADHEYEKCLAQRRSKKACKGVQTVYRDGCDSNFDLCINPPLEQCV